MPRPAPGRPAAFILSTAIDSSSSAIATRSSQFLSAAALRTRCAVASGVTRPRVLEVMGRRSISRCADTRLTSSRRVSSRNPGGRWVRPPTSFPLPSGGAQSQSGGKEGRGRDCWRGGAGGLRRRGGVGLGGGATSGVEVGPLCRGEGKSGEAHTSAAVEECDCAPLELRRRAGGRGKRYRLRRRERTRASTESTLSRRLGCGTRLCQRHQRRFSPLERLSKRKGERKDNCAWPEHSVDGT